MSWSPFVVEFIIFVAKSMDQVLTEGLIIERVKPRGFLSHEYSKGEYFSSYSKTEITRQ